MIHYFDASALVKRYIREAGSDVVRRLLGRGLAASSRISEVEVLSALMRRFREGVLSERDRDRVLRAVNEDIASIYIVELSVDIASLARQLLLKHNLRAGDSIQLASCLYLREELAGDVLLVAYDDRLLTAAAREGLDSLGT